MKAGYPEREGSIEKVSIPYRFNERRGEVKESPSTVLFQFLIGSMKVFAIFADQFAETGFNSL
ncbi:MAG: hypothetical protein JETT_0425 [Candidatus Jettenia ecosi]|uniref:Uncharacterized protein n=1 Tax=Candidatus Jettenia ecosi TaxID=2494326 RepID=A0A533QER2_9BACT|nr:MAG: hypothetical protein JETT_0425 [Candidatus Jettenia ecosi]